MRLESVTATIRPRRSWEAVDLGFLLARRCWRTIYGVWALTLLPFALLCFVLLYESPYLAALLCWWLKPVFDRLVLHVISRDLFGARPSVGQTLAALPTILFRSGTLWALTLGRLSMTRSYVLPVAQLEGLKGRARAERLQVLRRQDAGTAFWLTTLCLHFEAVLALAVLGLAFLFIPEPLWHGLEDLFTSEHTPHWLGLSAGLLGVLVAALVEPLYVGGGFALYLNRRTHLEGWDLELALRRLANRLESEDESRRGPGAGLAASLLLGLVLLLPAAPSPAAPGDPELARERIDKVLEADEFQTKRTVTVWEYTGKKGEKERKERDSDWLSLAGLGAFLRGLMWLLGGALVVWLVLNHGRWIGLFRWEKTTTRARPAPAPTVLMGMEIRPEKLPPRLAARAWELWQQDEAAAALSLLYRGALGDLVHRRGLSLSEGATEGDCLWAVRQTLPPVAGYFGQLTLAWQSIAYAHRPPQAALVEELCRGYDSHFGDSRGG